MHPSITGERVKGYLCSKAVFNLRKKALTTIKIRVLEKSLCFILTNNMINEIDLRRNNF